MPELPEVETVRRELDRELTGRRIADVRVLRGDILLDAPPPGEFRRGLRGSAVRAVRRRGKHLLIHLDPRGLLEVQLRMTGRFVLAREAPDPRLYRHITAEFRLDDGRTLFYDDARRLGGFRLLSPREWRRRARRLGLEPLASSFTAARLAAILRAARAPVKNLLLDQRRIAGIGNIYASEALHRAGIDPRRPARSLEPGEVRRLHRAVRKLLREATARGGTTFRSHRTIDGRPGGFGASLRVYGREGEPCARCGTAVRRIIQAGRSTFFCPTCQS